MKYEQLAKDIIEKIGGRENVNSLTHCVTRLRFKLKDENAAKTEEIKKLKGVVTVMKSGGQYQVVIGNHVPDVYKDVVEVGNLQVDSNNDSSNENKGSIIAQFIEMISGVFLPILGVLAATGMITGLNVLLTSLNVIESTSGVSQILRVTGDGLMNFLPFFLGYTAMKKFGGSPFIGMAIAAALVHPDIASIMGGEPLFTLFAGTVIESPIYTTFLGIPVILMSYTSTVIPIILTSFVASKIEKFFKKVIPDVVKTFLVPFVTILLSVPLALMVIGPIATWAGDLLGAGAVGLFNFSPVIAGAAMGGFWQVFVMFGLHWGLVPIGILNIANQGYCPVLTLQFAASFAQIAAVLAVMMKTKNKELKALSVPAFISGIFGVTEPAIYGVTLPLKKPFIISCIGGAIGGAIMGFFGTTLFAFGGMGVFGFPTRINPVDGIDMGFWGAVIAVIVSMVVTFVLTYVVGFEDTADEEEVVEAPKFEAKPNRQQEVFSPINGTVVELSEVSDPVFGKGVMGKGIAIQPAEGRVVSPINGTIATVFKTKHAIGLIDENGAEILIHIGLDTVELDGEHFTAHAKTGDTVKVGDLLVEFDIEEIHAAGYETVTPVIVTNTANYTDILSTIKGAVSEKDKLMTIVG